MDAHGTFYWNELMTHDVEATKRFYGATLGWTFAPMAVPDGTYWVANMGEQPVGGIFAMTGPHFEGVPAHWVPYVAVDDVDARLKAATEAGATVMREPFEVPGVGRIVILKDPAGAVQGWMTPAVA